LTGKGVAKKKKLQRMIRQSINFNLRNFKTKKLIRVYFAELTFTFTMLKNEETNLIKKERKKLTKD